MFSATRIALRRTLSSLQRLPTARTAICRQTPAIHFPTVNKYCTKPNVEAEGKPKVEPEGIPLGQMEQKMQMIYTCKVCSTRNSQTISKLAYTKGVVIVRCSGCQNNHLVADNLKWFRDNKVNIEDLLREKGEEVTKVSLGNEIVELVKKTSSNE